MARWRTRRRVALRQSEVQAHRSRVRDRSEACFGVHFPKEASASCRPPEGFHQQAGYLAGLHARHPLRAMVRRTNGANLHPICALGHAILSGRKLQPRPGIYDSTGRESDVHRTGILGAMLMIKSEVATARGATLDPSDESASAPAHFPGHESPWVGDMLMIFGNLLTRRPGAATGTSRPQNPRFSPARATRPHP